MSNEEIPDVYNVMDVIESLYEEKNRQDNFSARVEINKQIREAIESFVTHQTASLTADLSEWSKLRAIGTPEQLEKIYRDYSDMLTQADASGWVNDQLNMMQEQLTIHRVNFDRLQKMYNRLEGEKKEVEAEVKRLRSNLDGILVVIHREDITDAEVIENIQQIANNALKKDGK